MPFGVRGKKMEAKWKNDRVSTKRGTAVSTRAQPSALRHNRAMLEKGESQRGQSAKSPVGVSPQGFERRSDRIADNKRGQVYVVQRLSDPQNRAAVAAKIETISSEKSKALEFLQSIGVASAAGRLTAKFGG